MSISEQSCYHPISAHQHTRNLCDKWGPNIAKLRYLLCVCYDCEVVNGLVGREPYLLLLQLLLPLLLLRRNKVQSIADILLHESLCRTRVRSSSLYCFAPTRPIIPNLCRQVTLVWSTPFCLPSLCFQFPHMRRSEAKSSGCLMQCPACVLLLITSDRFGRFPYKISLLILSLHQTPSTIRSILVSHLNFSPVLACQCPCF